MTGLIQRLTQWLRPPAIADRSALAEVVAAQSAYISQKLPIDYVQARAHGFSPQLFKEKPFLDSLKICTHESYAAVLGDLLILAEGLLRGPAGARAAAVADRLADLYVEILQRLDPPSSRPDGWTGAIGEFRIRFAIARDQAPRPAAEVAVHAGNRMFATLPLHERFTRRDQDAIVASVQLRAGIFAASLRQRLRPEPLIADLARG